MADIAIHTNLPDVRRQLNALQRRQLPFAKATALTRLAQDGQEAVRDQLPRRFTIRRRWVDRGIRIERASKRDRVPESAVKSRDPFMTLQEFGGVKTRRQAIPKQVRRSIRTVVSKRRWPGALLRGRPRTFTARTKTGDVGVFQRRGARRTPIRLLWVLEDRVVVEPRFGFEDTVGDVVGARMQKRFGEALARAIATAR